MVLSRPGLFAASGRWNPPTPCTTSEHHLFGASLEPYVTLGRGRPGLCGDSALKDCHLGTEAQDRVGWRTVASECRHESLSP
jgi:hypothetical protein